jgi:hypothetical protein
MVLTLSFFIRLFSVICITVSRLVLTLFNDVLSAIASKDLDMIMNVE